MDNPEQKVKSNREISQWDSPRDKKLPLIDKTDDKKNLHGNGTSTVMTSPKSLVTLDVHKKKKLTSSISPVHPSDEQQYKSLRQINEHSGASIPVMVHNSNLIQKPSQLSISEQVVEGVNFQTLDQKSGRQSTQLGYMQSTGRVGSTKMSKSALMMDGMTRREIFLHKKLKE